MELERDLKSLLFSLVLTDGWVSTERLADQLGWQRKRVAHEVSRLERAAGPECRIERQARKGYRVSHLDERLRQDLLSDGLFNERFFNLDERRSMLALDLLFRTDYVSMEVLAERHYLSKTTVFEEIRQLKRWFGRMSNLDLEVSGTHGVIVHGTELAKRFSCTSFAQMHVLRLLGFPEEELERAERFERAAAHCLKQELLRRGKIISGEAFSHIVRYVGVTLLRDARGFEMEEPFGREDTEGLAFLDEFSARIGMTLTEREQRAIALLIEYSNVLECADLPEASDIRLVELFEQRVIELLQLDTSTLFDDKDTIARNINAALGRNARANHRPNYYDKDILHKTPPYAHVAQRAFEDVFHIRLPRYETINLGTMIEGASARRRHRSNIPALLVGDQDFEILDQVRSHVLTRLPFAPTSFSLLPPYAFEEPRDEEYRLLLTTSPEFALEHPGFSLVPPVISRSDQRMVDTLVSGWLREYRTKLAQDIWAGATERSFDAVDGLEDVVGFETLALCTVMALGKGRLCIISMRDDVPTGVTFATVTRPFSYEYHQITQVATLNHRPSDTGTIEWFEAAFSLLE